MNTSQQSLDLHALAAPLRAEVERLELELTNVNERRDELLEQIRRLSGALARLNGTSLKPGPKGPQPKPGSFNARVRPTDEEGLAEIRNYLDEHHRSDNFTFTSLHDEMTAAGALRPMGKDKFRASIELLHERGVIRLDRIVKGGGKAYKLTGRSDG